MGDYRKLDVWKLANDLSDRVALLVEVLPPRLRNSVGDQLSRAADAIHENIAEGCGLNTDRQLSKHLRISLGSANEVEDELTTLKRRGFLKERDHELIPMTRLLCAKLAAFINTVDRPHPSPRRRPHKPIADSQADSQADSPPDSRVPRAHQIADQPIADQP